MTHHDRSAVVSRLLDLARRAGADAADALTVDSVSTSLSVRLGHLEDVERAESGDIGLRVFIGKRQASASASAFDDAALNQLVEKAIAMARIAPEDPYCGLADEAQLARQFPDLDLEAKDEPSSAALKALALAAEEAARGVAGVTNSEGANAAFGLSRITLGATNGFLKSYGATSHSVSVSVLAGEGTAMERDDAFTSARHLADMEDAAAIGREAGTRAVARLNPRKASSAKMPIVYDPRVSMSLVQHFASAIMGTSVARGVSFLKEKMGARVFASGIHVIDDPHIVRGHRSKPFDGEGIANRRMVLADDGRLTTWIMDLASARQLKLASTGHAARGVGGPPSPSATNLYIAKGKVSPAALIGDIASGFYVTELIGMGVNGVTGDYSRGAAGFMIENGKITYPVSEVTIAGNLKDMFLHMTAADDLVFKYGTNAPTLRVEGMTLAGA